MKLCLIVVLYQRMW